MRKRLLVTVVFLSLSLLAAEAVPAGGGGGRRGGKRPNGGGCRADFLVTNAFTSPIEVWVFGEDGDGGYVGIASPQQRASLSHVYEPFHAGDSKCDRCRHQIQIQYRVPSGWSNSGEILCVDRIWINPCRVRETIFWGPGSCGRGR